MLATVCVFCCGDFLCAGREDDLLFKPFVNMDLKKYVVLFGP